jgi:hypothetical protein
MAAIDTCRFHGIPLWLIEGQADMRGRVQAATEKRALRPSLRGDQLIDKAAIITGK